MSAGQHLKKLGYKCASAQTGSFARSSLRFLKRVEVKTVPTGSSSSAMVVLSSFLTLAMAIALGMILIIYRFSRPLGDGSSVRGKRNEKFVENRPLESC